MYPHLLTFLGGYLHQDYVLDYGTVDGAIDAFLAESSADMIDSTAAEIDQLVGTSKSDSEIGEILRVLTGWGYDPLLGGADAYRDWLQGVRDRLQNAPRPER